MRFGPKPVILICILVLIAVAIVIVTITPHVGLGDCRGRRLRRCRTSPSTSAARLIGAAGGALQSASRTMMVRQANRERMTEAFGLYALAGKATTFLAPAPIAITTDLTGSQQIGRSHR